MMESMTQLMFKGYEEARVALTTLLFTVPCCILIGVEYGVFNNGELVQVSRRSSGQRRRVKRGRSIRTAAPLAILPARPTAPPGYPACLCV
jgi:hypothetical protein